MSNLTLPVTEFIDSYVLQRELSPAYVQQLRIYVAHFATFLERPATIGDFTPDMVNRWILWLCEREKPRGGSKYSRQSVRTMRRLLLTIWRAAWEDGLTDEPIRRVRKVKTDATAPVALPAADIAKLLSAADNIQGRWGNRQIPRGLYWRAWILTAWDSGLRLGDLLSLETAQVRGKSEFRHIQHKTGQEIRCRLHPETVAAIEATYAYLPDRKTVFAEGFGVRWIFKSFRNLCLRAGVELPPFCATKIMRRSSATAMEAAHPGAASRHLGHSSPDMARRHYIDPRLIQDDKPIMPRLVECEEAAHV